MSECFPSEGTLQSRSTAIIQGLAEAVEQGLTVDAIKRAEQEKDGTAHRDLFLMLLGLKPFASYLQPIFSEYCPNEQRGFLSPIAMKLSANFVANATVGAIWNPNLVQNLIQVNMDLMDDVFMTHPEVFNYFTSPLDRTFNRFMAQLSHVQSGNAVVLEGVLFGYPRSAAEFTGKYGSEMSWVHQEVTRKLEERGTNSIVTQQELRLIDCLKEGEIRDEFLRQARRQGHKKEILEALAAAKIADVPGFPYLTARDLTTSEEAALREAYASSRMDLKLNQFLASN